MFKKKKIVDERQEKELYKAEHYAYNTMFATVVIIMVIESYFLNMDFKNTIGEIIILMVGACTFLFNCLKTGNWDFHYKPSLRNYFLFSVISAFVIAFIFTIGKTFQYESVREDIWGMAVPIGVVMFISLFLLCFAALAISGEISKKRRKKLEEEFWDDEGIQNEEEKHDK